MVRHSIVVCSLALLGHAIAQSPGEVACQYIGGVFTNCAAGYSNFAQLPFKTAASCLCYEPTAWNPDNYDQPFRTCGSYLASASPAGFASLTRANGPYPTAPCRDAGNVRNYPEKDANQLACQQGGVVLAGCVATYRGFVATAPFADQAPCLCYRDGNPNLYIGPQYDTLLSSCLNYARTASPGVYSSVLAANGGRRPDTPCQSVKNAGPSTPAPNPRPTTTPPTPGSSPTPVVVVPTTPRLPSTLSTSTQPPRPIDQTSTSRQVPSNNSPIDPIPSFPSSSQLPVEPSIASNQQLPSLTPTDEFLASPSPDNAGGAVVTPITPTISIADFAFPGQPSSRSVSIAGGGGVTSRMTARPFVPVPTSVSAAGSKVPDGILFKLLTLILAWII